MLGSRAADHSTVFGTEYAAAETVLLLISAATAIGVLVFAVDALYAVGKVIGGRDAASHKTGADMR